MLNHILLTEGRPAFLSRERMNRGMNQSLARLANHYHWAQRCAGAKGDLHYSVGRSLLGLSIHAPRKLRYETRQLRGQEKPSPSISKARRSVKQRALELKSFVAILLFI